MLLLLFDAAAASVDDWDLTKKKKNEIKSSFNKNKKEEIQRFLPSSIQFGTDQNPGLDIQTYTDCKRTRVL